MDGLYARAVFHVRDGEAALRYYTEKLGFALDWNHAPNGRAFVFQVSLLGFQLILNECEQWTEGRVGQGRVMIGLEDDQYESFYEHVTGHSIQMEIVPWGEPTLLVRDPDGNWLTFWLPDKERATLKIGDKWP
jgi:catechol 2,3-dioxygenase-like lactoylglutathione lyase family enzyme